METEFLKKHAIRKKTGTSAGYSPYGKMISVKRNSFRTQHMKMQGFVNKFCFRNPRKGSGKGICGKRKPKIAIYSVAAGAEKLRMVVVHNFRTENYTVFELIDNKNLLIILKYKGTQKHCGCFSTDYKNK